MREVSNATLDGHRAMVQIPAGEDGDSNLKETRLEFYLVF